MNGPAVVQTYVWLASAMKCHVGPVGGLWTFKSSSGRCAPRIFPWGGAGVGGAEPEAE